MGNLDYSAMANLELIQRYAFYVMLCRGAFLCRRTPVDKTLFDAVTHEMCKAEGEVLQRMRVGHPEV